MELTEQELQLKVDAAIKLATEGLVAKNTELLTKLTKTNTAIESAEAEKAKAVEKAEQDKLASEGKLNELIDRLRETHAKEITTLNASIKTLVDEKAKLDASFRVVVVDQDLKKQLLAVGVSDPTLLEAASAMLKPRIQVTDVDGELVALLDGKGLEEFVGGWKETQGKSFIVAGNSGGDSGGSGGGGNTDDYEPYFREGSINLTKQNELRNVDQTRYDALLLKYPVKEEVLPLTAGGH